jgi:hypothetical protein
MAQRYGIDNEPSLDIQKTLLFTAAGLERVRHLLGFPVRVTSGYRCPELNKLVGGAPDSQHVRGEAVDFVCPLFGSPFQICIFLTEWMNVAGIDQMIMEGTWVHVSFTHNPRRDILTMKDGHYFKGVLQS